MSTGPKRQHWVPLFYLRHFIAPDSNPRQEQVRILHRKTGEPRLTSIRNIALEKNLYSPKLPNGTRDHRLEKKLCHLEGTLGTIWPKFATDFIDLSSRSHRQIIALFLAVQSLRHPERREASLQVRQKIIEAVRNQPVDADGNPAIKEIQIGSRKIPFDLAKWKEYENSDKQSSVANWRKMIERDAVPTAEMLMKKRWSIAFVKVPLFVTSDFPVYVVQPDLKRFQIGGKGAMIQFPISPTRILCLDDLDEPGDQYYPIPDSEADVFNLFTWVNTQSFMISSRPIEDVLEGIARVRAEHERESTGTEHLLL
jgi:hypothetical protein